MIKKKSVVTKSLALSMALAMTATNIPANLFGDVIDSDVAEVSVVSAESTDYGLAKDVDDGVILHAWNWSFDQIKEELPEIAKAGFTTVQTSPAQPNKDGNNVSNTSRWWKFYQPTDFTIGNKLGTEEDLTELCEEADKYGIKIIVDVVANHLANNTGKEGNAASDRSSQIPDWIRNNDDFWHSDNYSGSSDSDRYQMTRGPIGMPDLNTGNKELQDYIIGYLNDLQDCGVDGFRFDAAKHIETPSDTGFSSKFWSRVEGKTKAKDENVFLYGEILNTAGPGGYSDVQRYTEYIKVTNNLYGHNVQSSVKNWNASTAKNLSGYNSSGQNIFGSNGNEWVLWNESHDTYAGNYGDSTRGYSDEQMTMAWCAVAARYSTALYFVRPTGGEDNWGSSELGSHMMTYTDERIGAMNRFHNYFAGQKEYASTSDNVLVIERGTTGVALINYDRGSKKVSIKMNRMDDGTYIDQISGNTFTVSDGVLTGKIASGGVAAIYNAEPVDTDPEVTISKEGGKFSSDTLELTIGFNNATSGTYQIGNGAVETYTASEKITIGADMVCGDSVTITLTATDGTDTCSETYTFTKVEKKANIAYLSLPSGWGSEVYCYAYDSATGKIKNSDWPGVEMTIDEDTGYYVYEIPENIETPRVIFYNSSSNRTPGSGEKGYLYEEDGSYLYKDGEWAPYTKPVITGSVTVKFVDENGKDIAESKTLTGTVGESYTTSPEVVEGYEVVETPSNANGTYTKESITVTYIYKVTETPCTHENKEVRNAKPASCKEVGYTGDTYCTECNILLETGSEIAKTKEHSWDDGVITKEPTATEDGIQTYTCGVCGETEDKPIEATGCKHENTAVKNEKAATCEEAGYTGDTYCADCDRLMTSGTEIEPLGHSWDEGVITKEPTATEKGIRTYTCTGCKGTETKEIPATGADGGTTLPEETPATGENNGTTLPEENPATNVVDDTTVQQEKPTTGEADNTTATKVGDSIVDEASNATYRVISTKVRTVAYCGANNKAATVVVPQTITIDGISYKVTSIENNAFKDNKTLKSITIGSNIKTIGARAFNNCTNLTKVVMGKNVTKVGVAAFAGCKNLKRISLPAKVTIIGSKAFYGCASFTTVVMPAKLTTIGASAFYNCKNLTNITISTNVKSIGSKAFYNCRNLKKITIKTTSLTNKKVGAQAFKGINAKVSITVPAKKAVSYKKMLKTKGVSITAKIV